MLSEKLKENTKTDHSLLEVKLVTAIGAIKNIHNYITLLQLFYSYFGGLELAINQNFDDTHLPDYKLRRKTIALVNDLNAMKAKIPTLAEKEQLPQITDHLEALGALYVIEGSTLGGSVISKMMLKHLPNDELGLSFFKSYGEDTVRMWQVFKQSLDNRYDLTDQEIIIRSANETFIKFSLFFDSRKL
jgi:heme oxygenase